MITKYNEQQFTLYNQLWSSLLNCAQLVTNCGACRKAKLIEVCTAVEID